MPIQVSVWCDDNITVIYCYWNAIGFYWHEHTELALLQSRNDNCFDCSLESCQNASVPRQQSTEANAWLSRKSMGIQPLSRLYKNPLIVFCGNHSCCEWIEYCKSSNSWQLWLHGEKTAPAPGLIGYPPPAAEPYTNEYEVFLEVRFYENGCLLPVGKQALVANNHHNHLSNYILCVCVLLPFAKIRCEVAFINYSTVDNNI